MVPERAFVCVSLWSPSSTITSRRISKISRFMVELHGHVGQTDTFMIILLLRYWFQWHCFFQMIITDITWLYRVCEPCLHLQLEQWRTQIPTVTIARRVSLQRRHSGVISGTSASQSQRHHFLRSENKTYQPLFQHLTLATNHLPRASCQFQPNHQLH